MDATETTISMTKHHIVKCIGNPATSSDYREASIFGLKQAKQVRNYHQSFPQYQPTALKKLSNLADDLSVSSLYVKDESTRFGLNAFKVLGGSYCIGRYIANRFNIPDSQLCYTGLKSPAIAEQTRDLTFVTATDGNHGRGIAWTAHELGQNAVVYMPKGSARERLDHIRELGADAFLTEFNYDDTVAYAAECERSKGWVLVQDTAWDGYEQIPTWIMQGYTTMALETVEQLPEKPTHIFLQAGVGAMAGAMAAFFADYYKEDRPIIIVLEADAADCIYRTAKHNDRKLHHVDGDLNTIMAGLACGKPCTIGWKMLQKYADFFVSVPDMIAAKGMRILGNPLNTDERIISGESGAVTTGFVAELLQNEKFANVKQQLGIDQNAKILCFSTEGDTDRENYRNIVWNGAYPCKS